MCLFFGDVAPSVIPVRPNPVSPLIGCRNFCAPQLILLLWLLYDVNTLFPGVQKDNACKKWEVNEDVVGRVSGAVCSDYSDYVENMCTLGTEVRRSDSICVSNMF